MILKYSKGRWEDWEIKGLWAVDHGRIITTTLNGLDLISPWERSK